MGHNVSLWDYRLEPKPESQSYDLFLGMKTPPEATQLVKGPKFVYWSDDFDRTPDLLANLLAAYDKVYTPVRPTPPGCIWLPTGYDPLVHVDRGFRRNWGCVSGGTYTQRKKDFLEVIRPTFIFGNDWEESVGGARMHGPVYLQDYVYFLGNANLLVNIHHGDVGVGRRLFEFIACGPTITDDVPGIPEVLGSVYKDVSFKTPEQGLELKNRLMANPGCLRELWEEERRAVRLYTYQSVATEMLMCL